MSLSIDEDMIAEEEYLDDPIQLIPQTDNLSSYPEPEGFTAYKQKSYVPVTFFNIERNIKLLSNCHPLCIKLVDCKQYPSYCDKICKQHGNERNNFQIDYSAFSDDDDIMTIENESETLSTETKSILNKISSNGFTIKVRTDNMKKNKKIKGVDYRKNKGLIGMKISPTFEVIEIDDESDESRIIIANKEKEPLTAVTEEVNEESTDGITLEIDWTIENSKDISQDVNLTVSTNLDSKITEGTKEVREAIHSDLSKKSKEVDEVFLETASEVNIHKQETTNVRTALVLNEKYNTMRKDAENGKNLTNENECASKDMHEPSSESMVKTGKANDSDKNVSIPSGVIIADSEAKEDDCSKSPVFPCTPPKKLKKFTKNRHDTSKLVIHQPKDFTDTKFKPNRLSSPKATNERLAERVKFIQDNTAERSGATKSLPNLTPKVDVPAQNQEQIMKFKHDDKNIEDQNKNDINICAVVQQVNTGEINLHATSNQSKNVHVISKIDVGGESHSQNRTTLESIKDKQCNNMSISISKSQTSNKEQIIKLKLDENIYKDIIKQHKPPQDNNRKEVQRIDNDKLTSEVSSQANKSELLLSSKVGSLGQNNAKTPPVHIAKERPSNSHTIDNILTQNKQEDTSKVVSKKVHLFQRIGSAVLHERTKNISQVHENRPKILSKNRIRPFTGSICSWQGMARPNNFLQNTAPVSKNPYLEPPNEHQGIRITAQSVVFTPSQKPSQNIGRANDNYKTNMTATYQIGQNASKDTSARNDSIIVDRNSPNSMQNSAGFRNDGPKNIMHNDGPIAEDRANVLQKGAFRRNPQNCYNSSFGPHPRQYVRPIMRQDGTQGLGVTNYPRHMYSNTMNNNSVPINPYVGYINNYNSYWPYQYPSMPPPPPPPPPPNSNSVIQNVSQANGKVNALDRNKVNVIKQIHILARPVPENLQKVDVPNRPNLIDVNLSSTNTPKSLNSIIVNKSPNIVSSKTEMFEELEKEMMNIHHEDSENFIHNQFSDYRPVGKHDNFKSNHRIKPLINAPDVTPSKVLNTNTSPIQSTNKVAVHRKPTREEHNNTRNTVLSLKRSSGEVISKDPVKKKNNVVSNLKFSKLDKNNTTASYNCEQGYSPPILPIPTFQQTLDILTRASNDAQKRLEAFEKSRKMLSKKEDNVKNDNVNVKNDKVKKISLDEYKKRGDTVCERKKRKCERKKKDKTMKKCVEAKHSDQDQGYDSDSTIVL